MPTAYLTNTEELTQIAEAIRVKGERSDTFSFPQGFVDAIMVLRGGTEIIATNMLNNLISGSCYFPTASYIGSYAFASCSRLTAIDLPRVVSVYNSAFYDCRSVSTIDMSNCTMISSCAFQSCSKLIDISIPICTTIGQSAFMYCYSLPGIVLPECSILGSNAFYYCYNLSYVDLPKCESLGSGVFAYCSKLLNAVLPKCSIVPYWTFMYCSKLQWVNLPSLYSIGRSAFYNCSMLEYVRLSAASASISRMSSFVIDQCLNIKSIYMDFSFIPSCYGCLAGKSRNLYGNTYTTDPMFSEVDLYVPASLYAAYTLSSIWSQYAHIYSM